MKTTMRFCIVIAIVVMMSSSSEVFAGGKEKKAIAVPETEFVIVDSIEVEYKGAARFSFSDFRKANRFRFSPFDKRVNDENFSTGIKPGEQVKIYIVAERNNKIFTSGEAEKFIAEQRAEPANIAWLAIAQSEKDRSIWKRHNIMCFGHSAISTTSGSLIPLITAEGGIGLYQKEYPANDGEFPDAFAFIK